MSEVKKKFFPWIIGFLFLVVIILASFPSPTLTQVDPAERRVKVTYDAPFTLHFSQIMNRGSVERAFQLLPKTEGTFKWKDLRTLEFYPKKPMTIGDEYHLLIKGEARSIWMKRIGFDTTITYLVTGPPFVMFADPKDKAVITNGAITVMFDRPMDIKSVGEEDLIQTEPKIDGTLRYMGMSAFQFIPDKLSTNKTYSITIPAGLSASDGGKTKEAFSWTVVAPSLKVVKSVPSEGATEVKVDEPLTVTFDNEVGLDGIKPGVNALLYPSNDLDAKTKKKMDGFFNTEVTYGVDGKGEPMKDVLVFKPSFPYQLNEEYHFVLKSDTDLHLEKDFDLRFKTVTDGTEAPKTEVKTALVKESDSLFEGGDGMRFFIKGENPKLKLKQALSGPAELSICQIPSNEFIRTSAGNGWDGFRCDDTDPITIEKNNGLTIDLAKYADLEWVAGVYFVSLKDGEKKSTQLFMIEDTSLLMQRSDSDLFVWAVDIKSGQPIPGMGIEVLSYDGEKVADGTTDGNGIVKINQAFDEGIYVRGKLETETLSRFGLVSDRWTLGDGSSVSADNSGLVVLLNQNIFVPGDTLKIKGFWRTQKNHSLAFPDANQINVTIEDSHQNQLGSKRVTLRRNGSFDDAFDLPEDSIPGRYLVTVSDINNQSLANPIPIQVQSRASDLGLEWLQAQNDYASATAPVVGVKARYGDGIPAGNLDGTFEIFRSPSVLHYEEGAILYSFNPLKKKCESDCQKRSPVATKNFEFDSSGEAKLVLTDDKDRFLPSGYDYELRVNSSLPGSEPVSFSRSFQIHQGTYDLGLGLKHALIQASENIEGSAICLGFDSKPVAGKSIKLSLISQRGEGKTVYEDTLSSQSVSIPIAIPVQPEMPDGVYLLRAESQDEKHNKILAEQLVFLSTNKNLAMEDDLLLASDQNKYFVGGRAHLLLNEPKASETSPVSVVLTYERDGLLGFEALKLTAPITEITIPVEKTMFPRFLVTATRFNRGVPPSYSSVSQEIEVGNDETQILIDLSYEPAVPIPGKDITLKINTHNFQDLPLSSVISLNLTDGVPRKADFSPNSFFPSDPIPLSSASSISLKDRVISSANPPLADTFLPDTARSVYFNPLITTDGNGKAEVTFTLPEKEQDLQIQAFATKNEQLFGFESSTIKLNHQLLIQPILPSFAVPGDQTFFAASVRNLSDQSIHSRVDFVSSDVIAKGDSSRNISLEPGQQTGVSFNVFVDSLLAKKEVTVKFRSGEDFAEGVVPLHHLKSSIKAVDTGLTEDIWTGRISPPADAHPGPGTLEFTMSGSPLSVAKVQAKALDDYELKNDYQLAAKILANLNLLPQYPDPNDLAPTVPLLSALLSHADENGGYHFWNDPSASPTLSALALLAYSEATRQGIPVDPAELNETSSYLLKALDQEKMSPEDQFFILWVLGENEQYDTQRTLTYYKENPDMSRRAKAFLLMNLDQLVQAGQGSVNPLLDSLKAELTDQIVEEKEMNLAYFDDSSKTTAILLFAFGELDSSNPLLSPMANYLVSQKGDLIRDFDPEEAVWTILSLSRFSRQSFSAPTNFIAQIKLNGALILDQSVTNPKDIFQTSLPAKQLYSNEINDLFIKKEGTGSLYLDAQLTSYLDPTLTPRAEENMLILRHIYEITDDGEKLPATVFEVGKRYVSELEVIVPKDYHYVSLSDEIPAGMKASPGAIELREPFTQSLFTPSKVTYFASFLPAGVYKINTELRAILAGTYLHLPAVIQAIFEPSVVGRTEGEKIQVIN